MHGKQVHSNARSHLLLCAGLQVKASSEEFKRTCEKNLGICFFFVAEIGCQRPAQVLKSQLFLVDTSMPLNSVGSDFFITVATRTGITNCAPCNTRRILSSLSNFGMKTQLSFERTQVTQHLHTNEVLPKMDFFLRFVSFVFLCCVVVVQTMSIVLYRNSAATFVKVPTHCTVQP